MLEEFRRFGIFGILGAHDAEIVVGTGQNFRNENAILRNFFGLRGFACSCHPGKIRLHHRLQAVALIFSIGLKEFSDPLRGAAFAAARLLLLLKHMLLTVLELSLMEFF